MCTHVYTYVSINTLSTISVVESFVIYTLVTHDYIDRENKSSTIKYTFNIYMLKRLIERSQQKSLDKVNCLYKYICY